MVGPRLAKGMANTTSKLCDIGSRTLGWAEENSVVMLVVERIRPF
jgi:hypothetical protein